MAKQVCATIVLLCLCTPMMGGCNKGSPLLRDKVRVALEAIQPQPSQPLAVAFAAPGDHWNDENGVPWAVARSLAQMCKLSYASEAEINTALAAWGFPKVSHFQNGSLYACIASNDHTVLIAFRGTDDSKDWLVNADATPQPVRHGIIHRGFHQGMKTLYPGMVAAATDQGVENKHLWITGHSLGALWLSRLPTKAWRRAEPRPPVSSRSASRCSRILPWAATSRTNSVATTSASSTNGML